MLTEKQIHEIREHLEMAQNPIIFYDNDADGLCSFALLRKFLGRGKGVAIRTNPEIDKGYAKKISELKADYVFVLDKPFLGKDFVEEVKKTSLPIVWIDHHEVSVKYDYDSLHIYNPTKSENSSKSYEPVTYLVYKVIGKKEDSWLAVAGCIADHYLPDFAKEFAERYPELWNKEVKKPFDAYYNTQIGLIARAIGFGLKDSTTHIIYLQNFLTSAIVPQDVLSEIEMEGRSSSSFAKKYREIRKKYDSLVEKAREHVGKKIVFFKYGGGLSISSEIANELSHFYPNRIIIVAYDKGTYSNISMRGNGARNIFDEVREKFENASGGGHIDAIGARMKTSDVDRFRDEIEKIIDKV